MMQKGGVGKKDQQGRACIALVEDLSPSLITYIKAIHDQQ